MMRKKAIISIAIFVPIIFMVIGVAIFMHAMDYDNADSQVSSSINASKHDGFFVAKYDTLFGEHSSTRINEAWIEHIWYNTIQLFTHGTKKEKELQLVLTFDNSENSQLKSINNENCEIVRKSNQKIFKKEYTGNELRNCNISMDSILPDTVILLLKRRTNVTDTFKVVSQITLIKH